MRRLRTASLIWGIALAAPGALAQGAGDVKPSGDTAPAAPKADDAGDAAGRKPGVGPGAGAGARHVETPPKVAPPAATAPVETSASAAPAAPPKSDNGHRKGRAPKRPATTLPAGSERPKANDSVRRAIAQGPTLDDARAGTNDPELRALREADRVLFPRPVVGLTPGFSWDVGGGKDVVATGLPPTRALPPAASAEEPARTAEWLRTLTMPNLPVRLEPSVVAYLKFYRDNTRGRAIARTWAKKSGRFTSALKAELAAAGLPTDLVWLSLIESGHNPEIFSPVGAAGLWQFMPATGQMYGLVVDRWVDERLDPKRSTEAAIGYLSDLHRRFGTWELAMAAYNMGHGGLSRSIQKFNTNDFWELSKLEAGIPWETALYVPKIAAIAIVMNNQRAFGIADVTPDAPEAFETVLVDSATPLSQVAQAAGVAPATLERLNPQLLAARVPPTKPGESRKRWRVRVPGGSGVATTERMASSSAAEPTLLPHVVRAGETVESIAQTRAVRQAELVAVNRLSSSEALTPGTVLLVPSRGKHSLTEPSAPEVVVVPARHINLPDRERVFVVLRSGDALGTIARALGVSVVELAHWNALDERARLVAGMTLQAFVERGASFDAVRVIRERETRVLVAGSPEFIDHFESQNGKQRLTVTARAGETLAAVGRRYGLSSGWMERINRKDRNAKLAAGDSVIVYVKRPQAVAVKAPEPEPGESTDDATDEPAGESSEAAVESSPGG